MNIYEILKVDLEISEGLNIGLLGMTNPTGMTISHYAGSWMSAEADFDFTFEGVEEFTPYVKDIDFYIVSRQKVDMVGVGVNETIIKENGEDVGKYNYKNKVPAPTLDLPPGFTELYRG